MGYGYTVFYASMDLAAALLSITYMINGGNPGGYTGVASLAKSVASREYDVSRNGGRPVTRQ